MSLPKDSELARFGYNMRDGKGRRVNGKMEGRLLGKCVRFGEIRYLVADLNVKMTSLSNLWAFL